LSSRAGAASKGEPEVGNVCGTFVERGSGVTRIVIRHAVKKEEDTWTQHPEVLEGRPGYLPGITWQTSGGFLRGCANAVSFTAIHTQAAAAIVKVTLAMPFGAPNSIEADCRILAEQGTHFTCHRKWLDTLNGRLSAGFKITSP
jgi:hypothetical protein